MIPIPIDALVPKGADAISFGLVIFMRRAFLDDAALIAHERTHCWRQLVTLVVPWWIAYGVSKSFRRSEELVAYKVQIAKGGVTPAIAAWRLSTFYRIGWSYGEAYTALTSK